MRRAFLIHSALLTAIVLTPPVLRAQVSTTDLLSARILDACRAYDSNPGRWLALESDLMATHASVAALPAALRKPLGLDPMPAFDDWRAASLSDGDLTRALEFVIAAAAARSEIVEATPEVPFAVDFDERRYLANAQAAFQREVERRQRAEAPRQAPRAHAIVTTSVQSDPELRPQPSAAEKSFRVRLAEGRYRTPSAMPPLVGRLTTAYVAEVHDADLAKARALYARIAKQQEIAALSTRPIGAAQARQLETARADTLAALQRLDSVVRAQEQAGYVWDDGGKRDLATLIAVLGGFNSPIAVPAAPVLRLYEKAAESVAKVEAALAQAQTAARPVGVDRGHTVTARRQAKIQMSSVARADAALDWSHHVLAYDTATKELAVVGPNGARYRYGIVEPDVLKALYRFAAFGQNAAISIASPSPFDSFTKIGPGASPSPEPILLDPSFVDTRVGRDLIAAGALPWDLERDLFPGGVPNPIAEPFRQAYERFRQSRVALLDRFCGAVPPLTREWGVAMSPSFAPDERSTFLDVFVYAVLTRDTLAEAKTTFLTETNYDVLAKEEALLAQRGNVNDAQRIRAARAAIDVLVKWLGDTQDRGKLLASAAAYAVEQGESDPKWIRLFTAALRAQKTVPTSSVAAAVYDALPTTTLAVLVDEAPTIRIEDDRVRLDGALRYRYATTMMRVTSDLLVMSDGAGPARNRVETIAELTDLVNGAMPALVERYAPLERVSEYSRILALLRWARQPGHVLAVDFAGLH